MTPLKITVSAGRTFNHPYESYSNLRPNVTIEAALDPGEDVDAAIKSLQAKAEGLVEDHKQAMLRSIEELRDLTERQREIARLEDQLTSAQRRIDQIRGQWGVKGGLEPPPAAKAAAFDFEPSADEGEDDEFEREDRY